jgi:hypothetical protein
MRIHEEESEARNRKTEELLKEFEQEKTKILTLAIGEERIRNIIKTLENKREKLKDSFRCFLPKEIIETIKDYIKTVEAIGIELTETEIKERRLREKAIQERKIQLEKLQEETYLFRESNKKELQELKEAQKKSQGNLYRGSGSVSFKPYCPGLDLSIKNTSNNFAPFVVLAAPVPSIKAVKKQNLY